MGTNPVEKQREYNKAWRLRDPEHYRAVKRKWAKKLREEQPEKLNASVKKYRAKNPERYKAQMALNQKIQSGKIIRPEQCSKCGSTKCVEGHHKDYSKPFDVEWVCRICHNEIHIAEAKPFKEVK